MTTAHGRARSRELLALAVAVGLGLLLAGCAASSNELAGGAADAGFWQGLWHGLISPVTFIVSLFNEDVGIYEVRNTGGWYDFGFMAGVSTVFGGLGRGGQAASARSTRRASKSS